MGDHWSIDLRLVGPSGERIDLRRSIASHGLVYLPPNHIDEENWVMETTLPVGGNRPRTIRIYPKGSDRAVVEVLGREPSPRVGQGILTQVRHMLRINEDFSEFYSLARKDPQLRWTTKGAGRMIRSPTVFEDVVTVGHTA